MESKGVTLKLKEKEILKIFFNIVKFCRQWKKDPTHIKVMDKVNDAHIKNGMDFPETLCYGIKQ